jgi:citrate lyase beta subunit
MPTSLSADSVREAFERLRTANLDFNRRYPGESGRRQPVHTVYGGAHLFKADTAERLGALALRALEEYAPGPLDLARAAGLREDLAETIHARVLERLHREPVEDFRADFEDGYGNRPDAEEDGHAEAAAREMAKGMADGTLPPFIGIRIKPFNEELRDRSFRTLDLFLTTLVREAGGRLPDNFVVTLPKVTIPEQAAALADLFDLLEPALGLPVGSLRLEIMIETPQAILNLPPLAEAARGRCIAAHFGTYDYTAGCNITAEHQSMTHPVCDFAKHMMQVAYAGTGLWLSDGATNVLPVPPHRAAKDGPALTPAQVEENRATVYRAWKLHAEHVRHSLVGGFYQGWDLHPAQLVTRYAALYAFFLEGLDAASDRLRNFVQKAAQATLVGEVFDDAATGQGLLNYFLRAVNCGAITEEEALERSGLTLEELRGRSFVKILKNRRG